MNVGRSPCCEMVVIIFLSIASDIKNCYFVSELDTN